MPTVSTVYGSLKRLLSRTRIQHIVAISAVLLLLTVGGAAFVLTRPAVYTGTTLLTLHPKHDRIGASYLTLTVAMYERLLASHETFELVAEQTGHSAQQLASATEVSVQPQTLLLHIRVSLPDARDAAAASRAIAHRGAQHGKEDELVAASVVAPAETPSSPTSPDAPRVLVGAGVAVLVILTVATTLLLRRLKNQRVA